MTIMAAEAGASAFEGEAAAATKAGQSATKRTGGRTQQGAARRNRGRTPPVARTGGRTQQGTMGTRRTSTAGPQRQSQGFAGGQSRPVSTGRGFPGGGEPHMSNYHGALLAEWLLAFVLVAAIPFSKPNQTGVSPYAGKDLVQLGTLTVLYWILAILAATGRTQARFAAWFGGLILLTVGLAEAAAIASAVKEWLPGTTTPTPAAPAGNASTVNPGSSEPATGISRPPAQAPGNGLT